MSKYANQADRDTRSQATPQSSQMIWMEQRIAELEEQLAELAKQEPVANVFSCRYVAELRMYSSQVHSYLPLTSGDSLYAAPVVPAAGGSMIKTKLTYAIGDKVIHKCIQGAKLGIIANIIINKKDCIIYCINDVWYNTNDIIEFVSPADEVTLSSLNLKV